YGGGWNLTAEGPAADAKGVTGLFYDASLGSKQLLAQAIGAATICIVMFGIAFLFFKLQNAIMKGGIRPSEDIEMIGLDMPEMGAGIIIGPSMLGLVGSTDDTLRTLGEIGVILLLLEVGMEMDLTELGAVGRASMLVASIGVSASFAAGFGAMLAVGSTGKTAVFIGAAISATSVGIAARVFGDLRALATSEARTVIGAAVADDVMGL